MLTVAVGPVGVGVGDGVGVGAVGGVTVTGAEDDEPHETARKDVKVKAMR